MPPTGVGVPTSSRLPRLSNRIVSSPEESMSHFLQSPRNVTKSTHAHLQMWFVGWFESPRLFRRLGYVSATSVA